jgi:type I restriction enzyme, R subunit
MLDNYRANWLTVVKELEYATKHADKGNRLDLTLFLPRYHQWYAVRQLTALAARHGAGHNW